VHQRDSGPDDAVPGQGRFRRTLAAAGSGGGLLCHPFTITNMFVANKYVTNMFVERCAAAG
jgi:hypothetical protein